jgi:hypothetical protein
VISEFRVSGFSSVVSFARPILDSRFCDRDQIGDLQSISIQWSRITRDFTIREFSLQSSDLYTLQVNAKCRDLATCPLMDGPDDFVTSQVEISPVRSRGLNLVHFLADPTTVDPLRMI